jgi:hypothetical protein
MVSPLKGAIVTVSIAIVYPIKARDNHFYEAIAVKLE